VTDKASAGAKTVRQKRAQMKPPQMDHASFAALALHKPDDVDFWERWKPKIIAGKRMKKSTQCMSNAERAKFYRLLNHIECLGDVEKAAQIVRVRKRVLDKWMNTPELSWGINRALIRAPRERVGAFLAIAKLAPLFPTRLRLQDGPLTSEKMEEFDKKLRESMAKENARLAAREWKTYEKLMESSAKSSAKAQWEIFKIVIHTELEIGDIDMAHFESPSIKTFFIHLGKCLSDEIDSAVCDKKIVDIARLLTQNPSISAKEAACELTARGWPIKAAYFSVLKQRLLDAFDEGYYKMYKR